jgi:hypothetical protein
MKESMLWLAFLAQSPSSQTMMSRFLLTFKP